MKSSVCERGQQETINHIVDTYLLQSLKVVYIPQSVSQVFSTVVVSKLTYATPAWWGFTTSVDRQRINAVLRRAARSDLWTLARMSDVHTFEDLSRGKWTIYLLTSVTRLIMNCASKLENTQTTFYTDFYHHHPLHHRTTV